MNILTHTTDHLTEAMKHYFSLRMKFRGSILKEWEHAPRAELRVGTQKELKH